MKRSLSSALIRGHLSIPDVGLGGCGEESKTRKRKRSRRRAGQPPRRTETKVKSTGDNPPLNSAGETGKTGR